MHLSTGRSPIPAFIGGKPILHWVRVDIDDRVPEIPTPLSLLAIAVVPLVVTLASLLKTRCDPSATAHADSLRGHPARPERPHPESGPDRRSNG